MSDIPRPHHALSAYERLQQRIETARDQTRMRWRRGPTSVSELAESSAPGDAGVMISASSPRPVVSMLPGIIAGAALVLLGLGGVWAWQSWSNRVSQPIDDRLPMLVASGELGEPTNDPTDQPAPAAASTAAPTQGAVEGLSSAPVGPVVEAAVSATPIVVHVAGAVVRAGVVELGPGARVIDALQAAGGPASAADLDRVNLAALVIDGERIHVPAVGEEAPLVVAPSAGRTTTGLGASVEPPLMLDLNTATADELEELPGVGPSTASAIVRTRESRGPFLTVQELLDVPGIGEAKLSQIEPFVHVGQ